MAPQPLNVLIIDDNDNMKEWLRRPFEKNGHNVDEVLSADPRSMHEMAIKKVEKSQGKLRWDLLILDIHFGGEQEKVRDGGLRLYEEFERQGLDRMFENKMIISIYKGQTENAIADEVRKLMDRAQIPDENYIGKYVEADKFEFERRLREIFPDSFPVDAFRRH